MSTIDKNERLKRLKEKLRIELGTHIMGALNDDDIVEVMLNPDGSIWTEGHKSGFQQIGHMHALNAESVIGTVAASLSTTATKTSPIISGELPVDGSRFEGLLPPVVAAPSFTIRKRAISIFRLEDYVTSEIMKPEMAEHIRKAITDRKNIVISGGTGTGKTTLANAIISEMTDISPDHRVVIIEDTAEIQCAQPNAVLMHTSDEVDMNRLLRSTMRMRPDRIIVGEVRGPEALTLLKGWNTGHPGGILTVHSNNANAALIRLEQLIAEVSQTPMQLLIAEAVDLVLSIKRTPTGRIVDQLISVSGWAGGHYETCELSSLKME